MVNDNKKKLYDALSGEYDLGTYEEFETALTDETKRRKLYDAAKDDYDLGTYEEYSSRLGSISEPQVDNITLNAEGPEKLRGFWANFKESSKGLWAGLKGYAGEQMNLFTGSSREEQAALNDIEQLEEQGINALDYLADQEDYQFQQKYGMSKEQFLALDKKTRKSLVRQSIDRELEGKGVLLPDEARQQRREQINQEKVLDAFHKALEMAGGDLTKAKAILREQATDKTVGDILIEEASETMSNMKQPEGFAGWVGNLAPQMIPSATALALNWVTKGKASNLSKWIGYGSMGGLTLSTAGMSMLEAREAGATNLEVWTTGIADGLIEIISEKIPFDRITGRVFSSAKAKVADGLSEAISSPSGKKELEELLVKANEKLGGKLFSKKNVGDGLLDTAYEAGGEFAAEALQTITTMIYENPENYPTISEVLAAGWEGAKAGLFMGSVLGGASKGLEHSMNKQRRQQQGFVDVAQIENENGEIEVVEVVGQDPATGKIAVLHNGEYEQLDADKIGDTFRFSYDEFENARLKNLEDEAIDEGTVNNGQVEGMRETVAKDIEELRRLDPNLSDESIEDLKAGRVVPEKGSPLESIAQRLREDSARLAELENAKAQERETKKNAARQQIESSVGQQFWMTEENNKDAEGNVTYTQSVEEVVYADGRTGYVVGYDDAGNLTMVYTDGTKGFTSRSEITDKMNSGEIVSDTPMGLDEYLDSKVDQESAASEQARMSEEYELNVQEMIATHPKDSIINLGTEEEKIEVPIIAPPTKDGVIVQMPDGSTPMLSWEDVAHAEKKEIKPRTDAQNEQSIVDQYKVAYASPVRSEEQVPVAEREKAVQETTPANPLPRKADGSVDQTALWNTDPVRWAKWNDEQRKDGGANSLNYVNNAIVKEQNALDEMLAAYEAESDFDARDAMEAEINKKKARLDQLVSIAQSYSVPAQQTVAPAGTAAPTQEEAVAPRVSQQMSEEEKTQMDAQHQERLEKAKSTAAKREAMQAYVNEISQGSVPMTLISMDGYEQVMKDAGCSEDQIEQVRRALKVAKLMRMDIPAFFVPRVGIFAFIENIPNIEQLRLTYVHERQHRFTSQDGRFLNAILNLGLSRERLAELVYKLSGSEFYAEKDAYTLADEIISYAMERAYTSEDFSVALQELGVEQEIIDIITEIDNEQRQDYTTHSSRRGRRSDLHDNTGRPQNGAETDRNSEAVSGGLLGQQGNRPSGDSNGGDLGGRQAEEGAEVISDEQLSAPFSGEPSQITAEDGEVIADTNGKGGVRFSIRTWREGGRDYLAAWLDNDKTLTDEEKADILARMDEFYENAQKYTDTYAPFGTWSEADVRYDSNGNPLMSVIKANGDYAMNLDFSLVCKKRRPLNRLLRTLINRNAFGTYSLKEREIAEINWILQEHGFEVACALCFVDSKRYRVTGVADVFAALYNKMVKALAPEGAAIAHFNYNGNPNVEVVENGIDTMADEQLNWAAFEKYAKRFKPTSVEGKVAQLLRENPSQRRLVDATDFIEAEGFEAVKANNQELLKLYNAKKGTGGPKASFGDVQYLNDILKKEKSFDVDKAYAVGGVRIQSFSDFVPHMYFDYMQLFAELAAKKLPAHAYTKEVLFAKIFGLTGLKINLSLVPAVVEGGIAPGLDAEGNYAWADAVRDAEGNIIQQAQTFPFDEAMEIQNAEGYSKNCGAIAVGISDEHIEKMLDDPNIQFIIPYHKSSLNAIVARMTNIDQYKDYTNVQTTKKASGTKLDKGTKDFNFNEYLHNLGENGTPQQAAQAYLDWCKENNFRPKFSQFAYHPNYYKLLVDFNTVDTTTGEYTPQGAVTMTFPTEQNAFGNVETLIEQGLGEDMALEEKLEAEVDEIANEVEERLAEIAKEPKLTEKQQLEKMAELADERAAQIKARSEGTIELVEEARKANALHRVKEAGTLVPGHEKGQSMMTEGFDTISFRVTKNTKATIESWCKKANLDQDYTDSIIAYLDNTFEDTTEQLCAARWYLDGKISLPDEDEYKVRDAVKVAKQNKVDPLSFSSPMEIIDRFGTPKTKAKPINPDTVKEFSNKTELPEEIVVYDVQDDFEGQEAVRKIIDTHWGEDANPWCLAARIDGSLERAKEYWQHYSRYPKRIAFRNGKLLAFFASADKKTWWDRLDSPHEAIPYSVKSKEGEYEVSTNYELKEGNKKATQVSVGKSDGKGKTAYFVKGRLDSAGIQDGQRNLFYSSFPAGATLTDSVYGPGNSIEIQYGPLKNVTQISVERRPKEGTSSYMRVGYNNNGVRNISFVENARSWDIRFGLNGDHIIVGRADIIFNQKGEIESVYSGAYSMNRTDDGRYEFMRGAKTLGTVAKGEKVSMDLLREFGEDGAPVGALLDFVNGMGWNRGDYPYPNPADADILRNDADVRKMVQKAENDINEVAGKRYLASVSDVRFRFAPRTEEQKAKLFDAAKAKYGTTNNFNATGYMLPDGSLLDFSEANDGGDPNSRSLDHRDIEGIIMDEGREYESRYNYVTDFVGEGAIRMLPEYAGFQLSKAPTAEQRSKLMDYIYKHNGEVIMEITNENGNNVVYMEYNKRTSPSRIFKDMDGYFNEGVVPGIPPIRFRVTNEQRDEVQFRTISDALYEEMDNRIEELAGKSYFSRVEGEFELGKMVSNLVEFADLVTIIKNNDNYVSTGSSLLGFLASHTDQHYPLLLSVDDKALRKQAEANLKEALSQIDDTYVLYYLKEAWKAHKNGLAQAGLGIKPSATAKFNKAIDARIEEIRAGKVKGTAFNFKKGEVSLDEVDALFKQLNTNEDLAVLHNKVMALAKKFDIKPQFAAIRGAAEGESLGDKIRYDYRAFNSPAVSDERKVNIITHELIHSVTSYALFLDQYMPSALTGEMRDAIRILRDVYSSIVRDSAFKDDYGASSVEEMVAELSNPQFRDKLKEKSLYQRIIDALLKLFGVVKDDSAFHAADQALNYIIENYDQNAFDLYARHAARSREYAQWHKSEDVRFRMSNENQAIFVSNAAKAVEGVKMEKATPEQWLKMIEKNGGLKAGEDKWMGLSDWLKASDKKTLTKDEVLEFVNKNMIIIEEQHYSDEEVTAESSKLLTDMYPGWDEAFSFDWDNYMEEPYANIWDNETAVELYNNNHEDQIELDEDGEFEDMETEEKVAEFGKELAEIYYGSKVEVRSIHGTRSGYTTRGLRNNREIALTVPTIEPWRADDITHFGDAGNGRAIAWIRFGETDYRPANIADEIAALDKAILDYEGDISDEEYKAIVAKKHALLRASRAQKVLVIDEIQSNRHQEGREKGYTDTERLNELIARQKQIDEEIEALAKDVLDGNRSAKRKENLLYKERRELDWAIAEVKRKGVPAAPFEKNWQELAMKRMLRYAAENGYDVIAWTTGDQQANRYDLSRDVLKISAYKPNAEGEKIVTIYYRDEYNDYKTLVVDRNGKIVQGDYNGSALAEVVGKEMALQIMNTEDVTEFSGEGLKIGGEGMRGFYDKMLPAFMNKYGKKWGVKVEDIDLPNLGKSGYTMHSVPVTEEMKSSVMEGQVMFRTTAITPEVQEEMDAIHASAIVMGNFMKAPNGKDTNLTEEQWLMVRTKNFKRWFGDWENDPENASKVVDENGEPKVVFHGGNWRPILEEPGKAVFNMRSGLMGRGAYFTDNFTTAADFAREKYEWENYKEVDEDFVYDNGYITEVFLNIRNEDNIREYYGETYYLATDPNQIKSATDNTGEFSAEDTDIRYRVVTDPAKIEELEAGEKIKVYRAMQLIDGKLYPPMSAKVDGELRAPIELGQWEEAEERPDLADNKGYFKLDKGNKKSLKARYNPYFHTSYTPLNDQFSEAQDRPNLVTVEVEIPVSELTSGYKADKAKDSVGEKEWKAGVIQGKLSGTRKVILSRWDKPVRIVPDSEVADIIVKMFEGKNIVMPSNVVTPSLRAELESRGVPFVETDNQGKMVNKIHSFDDIPQDWYDSELQSKVAKRMQLSEVGDEYFAGYAGSVIIPAPKKALAEKIGSGNKEVMIKRGVFAKMGVGHRFTPAQSRNILASSLYATNLYGQSQKLTRPLNWVIIKTGDKNTATVIEVNETKDYLEVVSWYTLDERNLKRIKRQAQSEGGDILILDSEEPLAASLSALPSDLSSESKGSDNIDTANELEENISFSTGTPTEEVVAEGVNLSKKDLANLAGDIFAALPEDSRKKITEGLNENLLGLQDAIMQIPVDLAIKEEWNDEDRKMAEVVAEQMTKAVGKEMTRPFSASEALWTLYNAVNKSTDLVSEASRALVRRNLGFDPQTLEQEKQAKDGVRFRTVGDASANAQASMYNRGAANVWTRLKESFIDMNASVEKLVKAIEKRSGKIAQGFENILLALNQQSSKGLAAMEAYEQKFLNKMFDEIRKIMDKTDFKYEDIVRYVILKHGLERNIKLAQRDAKAHYQEIYDDIISKINGMNAAQKRTYLTNAQLRDADAKAELARLQAVNTSTLTPDQLRDHKKYLAKAKKEATDAAEHLARAQKIATMTEQDALDELDKIFKKIEAGTDSVYKEMRKNDYSGISSMFYDTLGVNRKDYATEEEYQAALMQAKADKYDTLGDIEGAAQMEVTFFENAVSTDDLWSSINKATKETLRQQYEANMISKDQYENLRNMFEFYVPLRGFADNTAEDMYTYYRKPNSTGYTKPILGAEGRKTEAESPFGWIAAMAGSAIASNVKNEAKLALYYFVSNRPDNGIATLSRTWFVHTPGDVDINGRKVFRPAYPPFNEDLSTDAAKQAYELWQEQMRDLQKQGLAYEAGQRLNLGNAVVNISDTNKPEHIVNVKVSGKDYTIVINGNPRAAQAINGDLNIEATAQDYSTVFGPLLRWMSSVNTSYNPEFWITNMMRDMAFTFMSVNIKEDPAYRRKFFKNYIKAFKVISMVAKNEKGTIGDSYIEQQYKDFVKYGGVTGYTQIKDSETWEKEIESYLASNDPASLRNGKVMRGMKSFFHGAHRIGESLEQVSRFAAFLTAVETGKSINEAINDAKEITVNFNRKGSGKMITLEEAKYLTDKNGQPLNKFEQWMAVGLSSIAPLGRRFIMFFNAAIQGLNATYKLYAKNKTRSIGWALGYAAVGMINAVLHAMLDDDDDYLDIPQYERRNSLMIGWNGTYAKWALPQEARAFYAFGDLAVESVMGRNPHQNALVEALKISTEVLPMNPSEGWKALMPSVAIPFVELALNEDYKGAPIYNEQKWLSEEEKKRSAKWSKAYSGTGKIYVDMAKVLNAVTGGDEHDAGLVNLQPEKIEHIVQSAFGGTIRTADKFVNTIMAAIDPEEDVTVRQFPFLNRILTVNDERYKNVHVNDLYDYYAAEAEHAMTLLKQYKKDRDKESYTDLLKSDEYKWAQIYSKYKKPIKKYQEAIRAADTTRERMELMKQQDELKRRMIKEISEL